MIPVAAVPVRAPALAPTCPTSVRDDGSDSSDSPYSPPPAVRPAESSALQIAPNASVGPTPLCKNCGTFTITQHPQCFADWCERCDSSLFDHNKENLSPQQPCAACSRRPSMRKLTRGLHSIQKRTSTVSLRYYTAMLRSHCRCPGVGSCGCVVRVFLMSLHVCVACVNM